MIRKSLMVGTVIALGWLTPAYAETVWLFDSPTGDLGTSHTYTGTGGPGTITATAFNFVFPGISPQADLFGKNDGTGEQGVGLTNDPSGEHEITVGSYIQFDITKVPLASLNISFIANSTTTFGDTNEGWSVIGTNTAGTTGSGLIPSGTSLGSCTFGGSTNCQGLFNFANGGNFKYIDVTATAGNILVNELDAATTPLPGALPLLATGLGGLGLLGWRRKRKAQAVA